MAGTVLIVVDSLDHNLTSRPVRATTCSIHAHKIAHFRSVQLSFLEQPIEVSIFFRSFVSVFGYFTKLHKLRLSIAELYERLMWKKRVLPRTLD
jgi:hypothetical protein